MRLSPAFALLLSSIGAAAQVSIVEPATRAILVDGHTTISFALKNRLAQAVDIRINVRWLGPDGHVESGAQRDFSLPPGDSVVSIPHPFCEKCDPLTARLEYLVSPTSRNYNAFSPISGRLSLPNIADYAFTLGVVTEGLPVPNQAFEVRVLASHPLTGKPVAGVRVTSEKAVAFTDADGIALLRVTREPDDEGTIDFEGQMGDLKVLAESTQLPNKKEDIRGYTDKPIYQPGQTMHLRILALDATGHAEEGREFDLRIVDESDELNFAAKVKTSRYGIASTDWEIPQNVEPGRYTVNLKTDETDRYFLRQVSIRRYELPSFRVTATPDRPFYLVNEPARVQIRGEYLFGKPVGSGKVRVVAADDVQKAIAEGALESEGSFRATLNTNAELGENQKFEDRHYIAFLTDLSTNRTEQRKFDIRISREPVHLYAVRLESNAAGRRLYVTTYSPDGTPLRSDVEVGNGASVLGRGKTNRFGLARIELPPVEADINPDLEIRAVTADGIRVRMDFAPGGGLPPYRAQRPSLWLHTDHTLYHAGQAVKCAIGSTATDQTALLLAFNERDQIVVTKSLHLVNGRAAVEIPYDKRFGRALSVGVAAATERNVLPMLRVYYPGPTDLALQATPAQATYHPGDTAIIRLAASTPAALGVAIVDQSVLERASTDSTFGRRSWFEDSDAREPNLGGITETNLLNLDPARIDDADLQLVAEVLSADKGSLFNSAEDPIEEITQAFGTAAAKTLAPVVEAINEHYLQTLEFPRENRSFDRIAGYALRSAKDPWLLPFDARFSIEGANAVVTFFSSGPDKKQGTDDDFAALSLRRKWFAPEEALIREALLASPEFPATPELFLRLMDSAGLRFDALHDPWGSRMRAEVTHLQRFRNIHILSAGPDRAFGTADDVVVAEFRGSYFAATQARIDGILQAAFEFPSTPDAFRALLSRAGIDFDSLRDPWGHPYSLAFRDDERFTDQVQRYTYAEFNGAPEERKHITPIKQTTRVIEIRSVGEDGVKGTYDDFVIAAFWRILQAPQPPVIAEKMLPPAVTPGGTGTIAGIVIDPAGAAVPNAELKLNDVFETRSDPEGKFVFSGLPPGNYRLSCDLQGFQRSVMEGIPVAQSNITRVQLTLQLGTTSEAVQIAAEALPLMTSAGTLAQIAAPAPAALSTPRVRDYFPETLYWQPELITDDSGRALVRVKLADSVTTWHVAVIGSTLDGRIAEVSTEVRAFQPFLADLDVPQVLTAGDEISLPVPVRNYLERAQKVAVTAKLPAELRLLEPVRQPGMVAASNSANAVMAIRAETSAEKVPVQVTARGSSAADAIERPTNIHPDGERRATSLSSVIAAGESLPLAVSPATIAGSIHGQVKIYPSLLARILEAIEVLLEAPHGCGEQIISSTYPNLLLLKAFREAGLTDDRLSARAMKYLRSGYQRLLGYQNADGGFTYWGHGDTDVPLTAYALTFFADARPFIAVDDDVVARARQWLNRQTADQSAVNALRVQALARTQSGDGDLDRQLGGMARKEVEYGDPYELAAYALATMEANKLELAGPTIDQLRRAAQEERGAAWWALRANTPYHGWGRWGQVETTAMAVSALARWRKVGHDDAALNTLIDRGALFLLRNTGDGGAWATSQSTVRALMALLDVWSGNNDAEAALVEVRVNGAIAGKVPMPAGNSVQAPLVLDISRLLRAGDNQISLAGFEPRRLQVQLTSTWYETWGPKRPDKDLDMEVRYSTLDAAINDPVACDVVISRPAFRGYGMMIAEVGLPPGAEVDRGVLEEIIADSKNGVDSYEVRPDHVTFYVWPRAADLKFRFRFRPRFAMKAHSAQSLLYDFYNPDSHVVLAPEKFVVRR